MLERICWKGYVGKDISITRIIPKQFGEGGGNFLNWILQVWSLESHEL